MSQQIIRVEQLGQRIKSAVESDQDLANVWVDGEITGVKPARNGHYYMTLHGDRTQVNVMMWNHAALRQRYLPADGDKVTVHGSADYYIPFGKLSLVIDVIQPTGQGIRALELEQLRQKLEAEGLFDESRKRPLPLFPRTIGVVTSLQGAVIHDIQRVVGRRYPLVELVIAPAAVQGDSAPPSIVEGIRRLNERRDIDLIIVARGGGSPEDLYCFNDERILRAIHASHAPVISAVGHESDNTLIDLVADLRAGTPSMAAELAVPDLIQIENGIQEAQRRMRNLAVDRVAYERAEADTLRQRLLRLSPVAAVGRMRSDISLLATRAEVATVRHLDRAKNHLVRSSSMLEVLSPNAVLDRGYSILTDAKSGKPLPGITDMHLGQHIRAVLRDGTMIAEARELDKSPPLTQDRYS